MLDQFIALYKSMNKIDPVLLGYGNKLTAAQSAKNQPRIDSVIQEVTSLVNQ